MREIVDWLIHVERISAKLYREAAVFFKDPALVEFLHHAADDEAFHYQVMVEASKVIEDHPEIEPAFVIDQQIAASIEAAIDEAQDRLREKTLSKEKMIDTIVAVEYSEWNDIFLYVVNALTGIYPDFKSAAADIQKHLKHIESYLASDAYGRQKVENFRKLDPVWTEKILIVDDDPMITELLTAMLEDEGDVDTAANGQIGLEKIRQRYYRLVISDIQMPEMDGLTMYKKSVKAFPSIANRYLFFSGNPSQEAITFLDSNDIRFVLKPGSLVELKNQALDTMLNRRAN